MMTGREKPPAHLCDIAKREWKRAVKELVAMNLAARVDRVALEVYCVQYGIFVRCAEIMAKSKLTIETPNGMKIQSPILGTMNRAAEIIRNFCREFGFTPSSRSRMAVLSAASAEDDDPVERAVAGRLNKRDLDLLEGGKRA